MRVATFLALSLASVALAAPPSHPAARMSPLVARDGGTCAADPTRDAACACLAGFVDPGTTAGPCVCPDAANAELVVTQQVVVGTHELSSPKAVAADCHCKDEYADFKAELGKCVCNPGYHAVYANGILRCKPKPTPTTGLSYSHASTTTTKVSTSYPSLTPTAYIHKMGRRALNAAVAQRSQGQADAVEAVLGCKFGEKACRVEGKWGCVNVMTSLSTCGGCPGEATGRSLRKPDLTSDCMAMTGIDEVGCHYGRCVVDSCQRGFALQHVNATRRLAEPAAPHQECVKVRKVFDWLQSESEL
ncbi:hypothetical protein Q5752_004108 [Cryptotrichosporon argae]